MWQYSRYVQASMGKIRNVTSYILPSTELTQVNISISVGGIFCAIVLVTITILTASYLFISIRPTETLSE